MEPREYDATLAPDADPGAVGRRAAARGARAVRVLDDRGIGGDAHLRFAADDPRRLENLPGVVAIDRVPVLGPDNKAATAIMQSGVPTSAPVWRRGLDGKGQVIGVIDDGPPFLHHRFLADAVLDKAGPGHRKVLELRNASDHVLEAHANAVGGIAAGDELGRSGKHPHRGLAWNAKLVFGTTDDVRTRGLVAELDAAAKAGAVIHTNSFGTRALPSEPGTNLAAYDLLARQADAFAFANENHLIVASAGNVGESLHAPGTAKNALCVTAAKVAGTTVTVGDGNAGPTPDGRRKPDLMAVGCGISTDVGDGAPGATELSCATSWAAPQAAAAAALARQYFAEGFYPTGARRAPHAFTPTGALLKAVLLNSTVDTADPAGYPSNARGWGLIRLDRTLYFAGETRSLRVWDVRHAGGLRAGDSRWHDFTVLNDGEPLKITLVWTEEPPDPTALARPVVHSLDLRVTAPSGTRYRGNTFSGGASTPNDLRRDRLNNVQMVAVTRPETGAWEIEITTDVRRPSRQGYALVVAGTVIPSFPL